MSPHWYNKAGRRVADRRVVALVAVGLAILVGYQSWVLHQQHRAAAAIHKGDVTAEKVRKLSSVQCANTRLLYDLLNALTADSTSHLGSPQGRTIPGARDRLILRLYQAELRQLPSLKQQGCKIRITQPPGEAP